MSVIDENSDLFALVGSPIHEIKTAAQAVVDLNLKLSRNEITRPEYDELFDDITRSGKIHEAMFTEEVYLKIHQAFTFLVTLKSIAF